MATLEDALEKGRREAEDMQCVLCAYRDCEDFWDLDFVDNTSGFFMAGTGGLPIVWKNSGDLEYIMPSQTGKEFSGTLHPLPEREKYRAKFDDYSMEHYGTHYRFPDERDDFPDPGD